jgi:hypothetical protein
MTKAELPPPSLERPRLPNDYGETCRSIRLRQGFRLCQGFGGQVGGQVAKAGPKKGPLSRAGRVIPRPFLLYIEGGLLSRFCYVSGILSPSPYS